MFSKMECLRRPALDARALPHMAGPAFQWDTLCPAPCSPGKEDASQLAEPAEALLWSAQLEAVLGSFNNASECAVSLEK